MTLKQLEAFRATVVSGSVSQAAASINVTQPTISRLIADLEAHLGFVLLHRGRGPLTPTAEGLRFFEQLESVYKALQHLELAADDIRHSRTASLTVLTSPVLGMTILPTAMAEFSRHYPEVRISITQSGFSEMFKSLQNGEVDVVFSPQLVNLPEVKHEAFLSTQFVCALPPGHRLAAKKRIHARDLKNEALVVVSDSYHLSYREHHKVMAQYGLQRISPVSTGFSNIAYGLVLNGMGVGLLEPFAAPLWEQQGVIIRPFQPALIYDYVASFSTVSTRGGLARRFFEIAKKCAKRQKGFKLM